MITGNRLSENGLNGKAIKFFANHKIESVEGSYLQNKNYIMPSEVKIIKAYPNPFNPKLEIDFSINKFIHTTIDILNIRGRKLATLVNKTYQPGEYSVKWDASNNSSGVYFIVLHAGESITVQKVLLLKWFYININ